MRAFSYSGQPARVLFGAGTMGEVAAEVERLGRSRALVLAGRQVSDHAARLRSVLGGLAVAWFDGAAMHTPVEVSERAAGIVAGHRVDCVVALGGGSTIGLAKALAVRTGVDQVVLPTTYSGSEVTPVLGETADGRKTTRSTPDALPETVVYDVELTLGLPVPLSVASGMNALAHAVEALYSARANPVTDGIALAAVALLADSLPRVVADPSDLDARAGLMQAAWQAGMCLANGGMGLHHGLCHLLGGTFGLPHAPTHAVVLAHAMAYNAPAVPAVMARVAAALGVPDAPAGVYDLLAGLAGPTSLRGLGLPEADLPRAAHLAAAAPYPNPREVSEPGIAALLADAWHGRRPATRGAPATGRLTEQVVASFAAAPDPRLGALMRGLTRALHGFVREHEVTQSEWEHAIDFLTRTGHMSTGTRQEFILLSDTLGVSSMVDLLTNSRTPDTTPSAVLGPFYLDDPPVAEHGADIAAGAVPGTPLWVDVRVTGASGTPLAGATVDVWQSDAEGFYDVQRPDLAAPSMRARFRTGADGRLTFWTTLPAAYPIPTDGPVGELLAATGRHPIRAPHLHFLVDAPGHRRLITQLFVADGEHLDSDAVFGVKEDLITDFIPRRGLTPDGRAVDGEWRLLRHTLRVAPQAQGLSAR